MGESRAKTGFGQVDLQIAEETDEAFGELDWDFPESNSTVPPSSTQTAAAPAATHPASNVNTRQTVRRSDEEMDAVVDSTRIVAHAAIAPILEPPAEPAPEPADRDKTPVPASFRSSASGKHGVPSTSHVATNDRVALMREAYARGDAEGALAIASAMDAATVPPPPNVHVEDNSVSVEFGEETEIEIDEEEPVHAKDLTRVAPSASIPPLNGFNASAPVAPGSSPVLGSLTERQGIPRVLLGPQEISKLPIDHRAGFLLGFIDGMQTMEEILDVCAMPPNEALELIRTLVDMGVITIE